MTTTESMDAIRRFAEQEASDILRDITGTRAVVISTIDGFEVAYSHHGDIVPARIAAMASSISAIGEVVAQESSVGEPSNITIFSESGFIQVFAVRRRDIQLIINIVSDATGVMAQVSYRGKQFAKAMAAL